MPTVLLGSGCFWSKEYYLSRLPGVIATHVGFAGGHTADPTYQQVCTKKTGHAEVVKVNYDPDVLPLEELLKYFFSLHDATIDRRDRGGQYRSAIYFPEKRENEVATAQKVIDYLKSKELLVTTEISSGEPFYPAAGRHQQYCEVRAINPRDPKGVTSTIWADFSSKESKC